MILSRSHEERPEKPRIGAAGRKRGQTCLRSLRAGTAMPARGSVPTHVQGRPSSLGLPVTHVQGGSSLSLLVMLKSSLETLLLTDAQIKPHELCSWSLL